MSLIGALTQAGAKAAKKAPFYSAVDEALAAIKRPKGTGAEFYTELTKQAGVKKAELADRKLEQAFKAKGKITKEEAQQVLKDNPPPKLSERELVEIDDATRDRLMDEKLETSGYDYMGEVPPRRILAWNDEIDAEMEKYGDYKTAGGQNYREILLKLPQAFTSKEASRIMGLEADLRRGEIPENQMQELIALKNKQLTAQPDYRTSHWSEDPNVLAHMRVQDRKGSNGEKILHVEEIQSDWHQAGRAKGYGPQLEEQYRAYYTTPNGQQVDIGFGKTPEEVERMTQAAGWNTMPVKIETEKTVRQIGEGVPDAPFKKNWHELAMKRLLNYAADNGYDSIAITPGAEQAKRYDLSKQINTISWNKQSDGLYNIEADAVNGRPIIKKGMTEQELENTVGKEVANRIVNGVGQFANDPLFDSGKLTRGKLENLDLQVGGEGMMGFYDKMLPDYLNNFGKPYGAQVQPYFIRGDKATDVKLAQEMGYTEEQFLNMTDPDFQEMTRKVGEKNQIPLHNFPITPEMRESIKQKGLPLYQQVGIPTAGAGAASQMLEPEEEAGLAGGGGIGLKDRQTSGGVAPYGMRHGTIAPKGKGYFGELKRPDGYGSTELSSEFEYNNQKVEYPLIVPTLSEAELNILLKGEAPTDDILNKAESWAKFRVDKGMSPFASSTGNEKVPVPTSTNGLAKGGRVKMTTNRDTMFMELSNKKLKRK